MNRHAARRQALLASIDSDAFLVIELDRLMPPGMDAVSLFYLTGYSGEGALIVGREESVLLTDHRYLPRAGEEAPGLRIVEVTDGYLESIAKTVGTLGVERLGFSARRMNHAVTEALAELSTVELVSSGDPVAGLRTVKDQEEIEQIRAAVRLTESALEELVDGIEIGMTEHQIATRLQILMLERGAQEIAFEFIIAAGAHSYTGHHRTGDRAIRAGELLLCDVGARVGHYNADMTRTFSVGTPTPTMREIYAGALAANLAGIEALHPGATAGAVHDAIRDAAAATPHAAFSRIAGHGLGLEVHESPYLRRESTRLESGMVMTMEPGIYLPDIGGVRIEDVVVITDDGTEVLTAFPKHELIEIR